MFKRAIAYVPETGFLGGVASFNFVDGLVTLIDDEGTQEVRHVEEVELLMSAFELHGVEVFNKDVLSAINGKFYQVELHDDGQVQLHMLNDKLEIEKSGEKVSLDSNIMQSLEKYMLLEGNIYELIANLPKVPDFNVKIVKSHNGQHFTYFYACNNKDEEQIDLIKVLYFGSQLLEEEEYVRITMSYDEYLQLIEEGELKDVSPQELSNYVRGASSFSRPKDPTLSVVEEECCVVEEEEELEEDCCEEDCEDCCGDCGEVDCECEPW